MAVTTFPIPAASLDEAEKHAFAFLTAGAANAVLIAVLVFLWVLSPSSAPVMALVIATPAMAVATLTLSTLIRSNLPEHLPAVDLLVGTARWWSLFGLLLSLPAVLIVSAL